ncbi:hypothetical protein HK407_01g00020 [Ordospora pajunii]|uniref:uncharacterized protein n=1 Tax=Ordospora pajunii TaxID=3039483 RepID=UPI0029528A72|nr:uncharacterized protein HK407_01g00020 [Ordospora pajunii]KAH9412111.1 hypothetical protein HK407_01g00020 [Ordospora pajunii]
MNNTSIQEPQAKQAYHKSWIEQPLIKTIHFYYINHSKIQLYENHLKKLEDKKAVNITKSEEFDIKYKFEIQKILNNRDDAISKEPIGLDYQEPWMKKMKHVIPKSFNKIGKLFKKRNTEREDELLAEINSYIQTETVCRKMIDNEIKNTIEKIKEIKSLISSANVHVNGNYIEIEEKIKKQELLTREKCSLQQEKNDLESMKYNIYLFLMQLVRRIRETNLLSIINEMKFSKAEFYKHIMIIHNWRHFDDIHSFLSICSIDPQLSASIIKQTIELMDKRDTDLVFDAVHFMDRQISKASTSIVKNESVEEHCNGYPVKEPIERLESESSILKRIKPFEWTYLLLIIASLFYHEEIHSIYRNVKETDII